MSDIIDRLQKTYRAFAEAEEIRSVMNEAAAEIARLRAELAATREALRAREGKPT